MTDDTVLSRIQLAEAATKAPPDLEAIAESLGMAPASAPPPAPKPTRKPKPKQEKSAS